MTHTINKVREFHKAFNHPVAPHLTAATKPLRELRVKLIAEELTELCDALGVHLVITMRNAEWVVEVLAGCEDHQVNLIEVADALGDLDYVVQGANLVFGIPAEAVVAEIHRSNMSKLGADGKPIYREDGKVLKGPNYEPPNVSKILQTHPTPVSEVPEGWELAPKGTTEAVLAAAKKHCDNDDSIGWVELDQILSSARFEIESHNLFAANDEPGEQGEVA